MLFQAPSVSLKKKKEHVKMKGYLYRVSMLYLPLGEEETQQQQKEKSVDYILQEAKIKPMLRAENLELDDFINLVNMLE